MFIDANNLLYRSFYGFMEQRRKSDGRRVGGISGFLGIMAKVRSEADIPLRNTVVVWDGGRSPQREELYPDYKAHRDKDKDEKKLSEEADLAWQRTEIMRLLNYTGCRQLQVSGVEADDLISVFAFTVRDGGGHSLIYTGDKDFHQIITPGIKILDPKHGLITPQVLEEEWGTNNVNRLAQLKAITGDTSDNIKGVPGIGKKRAAKYVKYFHIPQGLNPIPLDASQKPDKKDGKWVGKILEHKDVVVRNYTLISLPRRLEDSFLSPEQVEEALSQWLTIPQKDRASFVTALKELELEDEAHYLHRW